MTNSRTVHRPATPFRLTLAAALVLGVPVAQAFEIDTGNRDVYLRWDNTVKYSTAFRLEEQSDELIYGTGGLNGNDGDLNFDQGLISNRVDILSELDIGYKNFGARFSGAAWYDDVYHQKTDRGAPGSAGFPPFLSFLETPNATSVPYNEFTDETKDLHGGDIELLDAFVYWNGLIGDRALSVRAGQHGLVWGESLFFGANAIAGAMAPVDVVKALSVPNTQFKELIRPVNQLSSTFQLTDDLTLGAFYQLEWEETRLPGSGSYFSTADIIGAGAENIVAGPLGRISRVSDAEAGDSGQGGIQLRYAGETTDYGFYAMQTHARTPTLYEYGANYAVGDLGNYAWLYQEDIKTVGASFITSVGNFNIAGEGSLRWNMPLVSNAVELHDDSRPSDYVDDPQHAVGRTAHVNLNVLASLGPSFISKEASLVGEVAWHRLLSITDNPEMLDSKAERDAWGLKVVYTPTYRQAFPGWDISVPVGVSYFPRGKSSVISNFGVDEGGDISLGVNATYLNDIQMGLQYTHYYGSEGAARDSVQELTFDQARADRDFVSFFIKTTF